MSEYSLKCMILATRDNESYVPRSHLVNTDARADAFPIGLHGRKFAIVWKMVSL